MASSRPSTGPRHLDQVEKAGEVAFRDYAAGWLASRRVKGEPLAERTVAGYQDLLDRFLLDTFGDKMLREISRTQVKRWYDEHRPRDADLRARAYSLLRAVLATAVDDEVLMANPAASAAPARSTGSTRSSPPRWPSWLRSPRPCQPATGCSCSWLRSARCASES